MARLLGRTNDTPAPRVNTSASKRRRLGDSAAAVAHVQPLESRLLMAASGGGGGGTVAAPAGSVYYADYNIVKTSFGTFPSFNAAYGMKADGTARARIPGVSAAAEPSRLLHGSRWMLDVAGVDGAYPNGQPRRELFATRV